MTSNAAQVQQLLNEMLQSPKDYYLERNWMQHACIRSNATVPPPFHALHHLIVSNDDLMVQLSQTPKRMCAYEFKPGDIAWNCKECQADETCVMCNDCFIASDHRDHQVFFYYTHSGGCCDCGDPEAWAVQGFCVRHKGAHDVDPVLALPSPIRENARECLQVIMQTVIHTILSARRVAIIHPEDVTRAKTVLAQDSDDTRYAVLIHHNELFSSQDFATALSKAHPAVAYQMLKLVNETSTHKQSVVRSSTTREDALELALALHRNGILCSLVLNDYKSKISAINGLMQYLISLAYLSDGLCRFLCEQLVQLTSPAAAHDKDDRYSLLRELILADSFLPKTESDSLHSLLMALLADPLFKRCFAIAFTYAYDSLYREFVIGVGSSSLTILAFSVQFFNRPSFVKLLVREYNLLSVLLQAALETLQSKLKAVPKSLEGPEKDCITASDVLGIWNERVSDGDCENVLHQRSIYDLYAAVALLTRGNKLMDLDYLALAKDSAWIQAEARNIAGEDDTAIMALLPGRHQVDLTSPVFLYRRYMSGLLDLRYALQIEGVSEQLLFMENGQYYATFLLYLSYLQGIYPETRRTQDHVEMESRAWVAAVEYVSTVSDVFTWIITNVMKKHSALQRSESSNHWRFIVKSMLKPLVRVFYFWLLSSDKYYPPVGFAAGDRVPQSSLPTPISCHYPIHRAFAQLLRTFCDIPACLAIFYELFQGTDVWIHDASSSIGFWHRVQLMEPVLQAIVWDAQVHCGLWVRNGMSVINHSMNYGEPPFCLRFRDLDLLLLQFSMQFLPTEYMIATIFEHFGVQIQASDNGSLQFAYSLDAMTGECLKLLSQLASEVPFRAEPNLLPVLLLHLQRELIQRLCVGPCAHSDLSKIANEFFSLHEHLFESSMSVGAILDPILKEICIENENCEAISSSALVKTQYHLQPERISEYNPCFIHLTRKQHESAHENWLYHRLRRSKRASLEDWHEFPLLQPMIPCPMGFTSCRLAILHRYVRNFVSETLWRCAFASRDAQFTLNVLSHALQLLTLQVYVLEDHADSPERDEYLSWLTVASIDRCSIYELLFQLDSWTPSKTTLFEPETACARTYLDGDQKHELGRGLNWIIRRLALLDAACLDFYNSYQLSVEKDKQERVVSCIDRRKEAQQKALERMRLCQAEFSQQMEEDIPQSPYKDTETERLDCAMCHMHENSDSFMCFVGFAQSSAVCSRLHGGDGVRIAQNEQLFSSLSSFSQSPMDEMHFGEDVPVHVRLCGHVVHQQCWESYHASRFQRVITGAHQRYSLNAVDVTKKEFLCPLCKSISNILVPKIHAKDAEVLEDAMNRSTFSQTIQKHEDVLHRLEKVATGACLQYSDTLAPTVPVVKKHVSNKEAWLENGLASLCMALHKVACGAIQKSRPERYATTACHSLFHTLLCTFLTCSDDYKAMPEASFVSAMRYLPLMLFQVQKVKSNAVSSAPEQPSRLVALACSATDGRNWCYAGIASNMRKRLYQLLYFGGSEIQADGTIVLEDEHPSTQTQTRKQSQWGKLRRPHKPLLLSHLGTALVKSVLLASCKDEAVSLARLVILARFIQTILFLSVSEDAIEKSEWIRRNTQRESAMFEQFDVFLDSFSCSSPQRELVSLIERLYARLCPQGRSIVWDTRTLLYLANEIVPMAQIAVFIISSQFDTEAIPSPRNVSKESIAKLDLFCFSELRAQDPAMHTLLDRWVRRFQHAYDEMHDPNSLLPQWLTSINVTRDKETQLTFPMILSHDLYEMQSALSIHCAAQSRMRYLRSLPHAFVQFYSELYKRKCEACHQFPTRPAVCLLCGLLLCASNTCRNLQQEKAYPEDSNPGACTIHAKKCGRGVSMFLLVLEGAVLLVYYKLAAYVGSLYVDEYGEEFGERNRDLNKGRPLYLNVKRRDRLLRLWQSHEIPNEVVKIQNTSERVIRNSHY